MHDILGQRLFILHQILDTIDEKNFDIVEIEGVNHLYLQDSDIKFVAEIEEFNENPLIYTEKPEIIV